MKRSNVIGLTGTLLLLASDVGVLPAAAVSITIQPSSTIVSPGQTFSLDIAIADVSDVFAFQFDLGFNREILAANAVTEGPLLPSRGSTCSSPAQSTTPAGLSRIRPIRWWAPLLA